MRLLPGDRVRHKKSREYKGTVTDDEWSKVPENHLPVHWDEVKDGIPGGALSWCPSEDLEFIAKRVSEHRKDIRRLAGEGWTQSVKPPEFLKKPWNREEGR